MQCDECGGPVPVGSRYCGTCGGQVAARTVEMTLAPLTGSARGARPQPARRGRGNDPRKSSAGGALAPQSPPLQRAHQSTPLPSAEPDAASLAEVEAELEALVLDSAVVPAVAPGLVAGIDEEQVRGMFGELLSTSAAPLRDFMIELRLGEPHSQWLYQCEASLLDLHRSAQGMGDGALVAKLERVSLAVSAAKSMDGDVAASVRREARDRIIGAYGELIAAFPGAFGVEEECNRREGVIIRSLLARVDGLLPLARDRIYQAGLASLGMLYVSSAEDVASIASLPLDLAARVLEAVERYRSVVTHTSPQAGRRAERDALALLAAALTRTLDAYDRERDRSRRRALRVERSFCSSAIDLSLARLGNLPLVQELATVGYRTRVELVLGYLTHVPRSSEVDSATSKEL